MTMAADQWWVSVEAYVCRGDVAIRRQVKGHRPSISEQDEDDVIEQATVAIREAFSAARQFAPVQAKVDAAEAQEEP